MRILVLSDIHYPFTDEHLLSSVLRAENHADKVVFLGDTIESDAHVGEFLALVRRSIGTTDVTFVRGDDDAASVPADESLELRLGGQTFLFVHGNRASFLSETTTGRVVLAVSKVHPSLPVLGYALISRLRIVSRPGYLIIGHAHVLRAFPRIRVACAGSLTTKPNVYNDRGYVVIDDAEGLKLSLVAIDGGRQVLCL